MAREYNELDALDTNAKLSFYKFLAVIILILAFLLAGRIFIRQQEAFARVEKRREFVEQKYNDIVKDAQILENQYKNVETEQQLEELAREELGFVRPGDIVYQDIN